MGPEFSKLGLSPVKVNQKVVNSVLAVGLKKYFSNVGNEQCISHFLEQRVCTQQSDPAKNIFAAALSTLGEQYQFNMATDIPALGGYYYKVFTLEERLHSSNLPEVGRLFKSGYINPFMYDPEKSEGEQKFKKPADMSEAKFKSAILYLYARLMHIQYVMEQHRAGASFGAQVCSAYKEKLAGELKLQGLEKKIFDMGFMQAGIKSEHIGITFRRKVDTELSIL